MPLAGLKGRIKIVVVEDEDIDFKIIDSSISIIFEDRYQVFHFNSYKELLEKEIKADILLADLYIKGVDESEQIKSLIKNEYRSTPVIILTGKCSPDTYCKFISEGAYDYVYKAEALEYRSTLIPRTIINCLERKRLYEELKTANKFKSKFIAVLSHEIRTPLNVISGITQILDEKTNDPYLKSLSNILDNNVNSLLDLVNDIVDFSKIESGKLVVKKSLFSPIAHILEVVELMMVGANKKKIDLEFVVDELMPHQVITDVQRVKQILINLLSNSIKFTEKGKVVVRVCLDEKLEKIVFLVEDTGVGMSKKEVGEIFHEYVQANADIEETYGGSGLGLSISKRLVSLLGGEITVGSVKEKGTVFTVSLPIGITSQENYYKYYDENINGVKNALVSNLSDEDSNTISKTFKSSGVKVVVHPSDSVIEHIIEGHFKYDVIYIGLRGKELGGFDICDKLSHLKNIEKKIVLVFPPVFRSTDVDWLNESQIKSVLTRPVTPSKVKQSLIDSKEEFYLSPKEKPSDIFVNKKISGKVLLAEDFDENALVFSEFLKGTSVIITRVKDGEEACRAAFNEDFDLIFMDLKMPRLNGFDAAKKIKNHVVKNDKEFVPIVALSASDKSETLEEDQKIFDDYLIKPFKKRVLIGIVKKYLNNLECKLKSPTFQDEEVNFEFQNYLGVYFKSRWKDYDSMVKALEEEDFKSISEICHKILGSAKTFGLEQFNNIVTNIKECSGQKNRVGSEKYLSYYFNYLKSATQTDSSFSKIQ